MYELLMLGFITMAFFAVSMGLVATFVYGIWVDYQEFKTFKKGFMYEQEKDEDEPHDPTAGW